MICGVTKINNRLYSEERYRCRNNPPKIGILWSPGIPLYLFLLRRLLINAAQYDRVSVINHHFSGGQLLGLDSGFG